MATIRKHEQLIAWQLGQELSQRVAAILSQSQARWGCDYCSELRKAADASSANIAEGFDRYRLPGFRYFLEIANGSLGETSRARTLKPIAVNNAASRDNHGTGRRTRAPPEYPDPVSSVREGP